MHWVEEERMYNSFISDWLIICTHSTEYFDSCSDLFFPLSSPEGYGSKTMGLPSSSSQYLSCLAQHVHSIILSASFTTHHLCLSLVPASKTGGGNSLGTRLLVSGTQRCRFYSNFSFPISRSYLYFCSVPDHLFFREVAWLSQWTARKLKVQGQDSVVLLVEPCIGFSPTSSLGTSPGCSKVPVMIDWSIAPNFNVCNNSFRTFECDMVYVLSVFVRVWKKWSGFVFNILGDVHDLCLFFLLLSST